MKNSIWKKLGYTLLVLYLVAVTVGCGFLGYLYFDKSAEKDTTLDTISARVLLNEACYDLGIISKDEYTGSVRTLDASANIVEYENKNDVEFDNLFIELATQGHQYTTALLIAKFAFDEGVAQNTIYHSASGSGAVVFKYSISGDTLKFVFYPNEKTPESYTADTPLGETFYLQQTTSGWNFTYYLWSVSSGAGNLCTVQISSDEIGPYRCETNAAIFNANNLEGGMPGLDEYKSLDETITGVVYFDQNLKTKKAAYSVSNLNYVQSYGERPVKLLSSQEQLNIVNLLVRRVNRFEIKTWNDVKNWEKQECNFYSKVLEKLA